MAPTDPGTGGGAGPRARPPGTYAPEIVVLLTDGANTTGVEPVDAAKAAAARGVRVYPIGFGTRNPAAMVCSAAQLGGRGFEGLRRRRPGRSRVAATGAPAPATTWSPTRAPCVRWRASPEAEYFAADDAGRLQNVLKDLPRTVATQQRDVEVSVVPVAVAALLLLGALWAAARWTAFPH